jgi:hypothetical protein
MPRMTGKMRSWQWMAAAVVCCAGALAVGQMTGKMPLPREGTDLDSGPTTRPEVQVPLPLMRSGPFPDHAMPAPKGDPATPAPAEASKLVVHEWGVWVRGVNPGAGGGFVLGSPGQLNAQLPQWVIKRNLPMNAPRQMPPDNGRENWDKPVIHFYHGEGLDVKVVVTTALGAATAYWPPAACWTKAPPPPGAPLVKPVPQRITNVLTWSGKLSAEAPVADNRPDPPAAKAPVFVNRTLRDVPDGHWWSAIRKVPGLYLTTPSGSERFIFYESTAAQDPILKAIVSGETLTVQNTSASTPSGPVVVILNDGQKLHWVSAKDIAAGTEVKWTRADVEKGQADAAKLLEFSRGQWETFGLTKEEAAAIVEVWKADLTGHVGLLVVGKMPRDVYDQMFPLEVTPKPAQIVRVGVVFDSLPGQEDRTKWLPGLEAQLQQWGKELDDDKFEVREAAYKKFAQTGELAKPYLKKLAETGSAEVKNAAQRLLKEIEQQEQVGGPATLPVVRQPIIGGPPIPPPEIEIISPIPVPLPAPIE